MISSHRENLLITSESLVKTLQQPMLIYCQLQPKKDWCMNLSCDITTCKLRLLLYIGNSTSCGLTCKCSKAGWVNVRRWTLFDVVTRNTTSRDVSWAQTLTIGEPLNRTRNWLPWRSKSRHTSTNSNTSSHVLLTTQQLNSLYTKSLPADILLKLQKHHTRLSFSLVSVMDMLMKV